MEIFKLFESTINHIQPGHLSHKDLRRDQILDNYDEATRTLQTLIKAKESEITYRRDLVDMLEKSKQTYDNKLAQAKHAYQTAKRHAPESLDLKSPVKKPEVNQSLTSSNNSVSTSTSAIPTIGGSMLGGAGATTSSLSTTPPPLPFTTPSSNHQPMMMGSPAVKVEPHYKGSDLDIPLPNESAESRSSLDRRLSEFLKTFPNLTQAGMAQSSTENSLNKPPPGYYTQQQPQPQSQPPPLAVARPPVMAMMRFPPPSMMSQVLHPSQLQQPHGLPSHNSNIESHEAADMDLSDGYDEPTNNIAGSASTNAGGNQIPMVASAMQQGAGGKQNLRSEPGQSGHYIAGQHYGSPIAYTPRLNPLPFDPSIMEPRLTGAPSSSTGGPSTNRDRHHSGERSGHRHSGGSSSSGGSIKHVTSEKNKYSSSSSSSSQSSSRSKRR